MYGPTKGEMTFLVTLAVIGLGTTVLVGMAGLAMLFGAAVRALQ